MIYQKLEIEKKFIPFDGTFAGCLRLSIWLSVKSKKVFKFALRLDCRN